MNSSQGLPRCFPLLSGLLLAMGLACTGLVGDVGVDSGDPNGVGTGGPDGGDEQSGMDAGRVVDSGRVDAGPQEGDAGSKDAGASDAGRPDAGGGLAKRDPAKWPYSKTSIWNMPIGTGARYVPANIPVATAWGMTIDEEILVLTPTASLTPVNKNTAGWSMRDRCQVDAGPELFKVPIPTGFLYQRSGTPNGCFAGLMPDGRTVVQTQPFARCVAGGPATGWFTYGTSDLLTGDGMYGSHGGSYLSALGGSLRVGELLPNSPPIRHALKVNIYATRALWNCTQHSDCYRWPALQADNRAENFYGGTVPALKMGALLALKASVSIDSLGLQTEPAKRLAWTLQNFGAYVVDDTAWDVYALNVETGPAGDVASEFAAAWGFSIHPQSTKVPWALDMARIFSALHVVDNNGPQSIGGGGTPLQPLAPDFQ